MSITHKVLPHIIELNVNMDAIGLAGAGFAY